MNVLGVEISDYKAKQAMKATVDYMNTDPLSIIELITVDTLMCARQEPTLKGSIAGLDLVLPGEKAILEAADIADAGYLKEVSSQVYLRMIFRYLHKNHKRVFLLVETEEEARELCEFLAESYEGIQIIGMAKVSAQDQADERVVNAVNGAEVDCVIATLSAPVRERFAERNRQILNARVWLGVGKTLEYVYQERGHKERFLQFLLHRIFKREIQKNRKEQ